MFNAFWRLPPQATNGSGYNTSRAVARIGSGASPPHSEFRIKKACGGNIENHFNTTRRRPKLRLSTRYFNSRIYLSGAVKSLSTTRRITQSIQLV